ncbi:High-affinity zinc uptake system protein ZnuA precursor [Vibrio thalassae]|uniref:High-affinity zinc uptake system protein ZnuA n=1 Tax=Vibrio thalassae TaxID=1243014 RepID=A0A240EGK1_9VIBR|nr:zinc ABC transporter substrate-binding protein [Vibrio thalassae]SNX47792.1 High-affinity zinc uptake system protein ZnuA precursor [Vibrio thalassae]
MFRKALSGMVVSLVAASNAYAQVPNVAVDIAPLHSLVSQVMDGVGEPDLLIRPESSPHEYHLRPSEAKALSEANVVFWVGEGLTPWLEKPLSSLAGSAKKVEMMEVDGTTLYDFREGATFEAHEHHGDEAHHDEHDHEHHDADHHDKHQEEHHGHHHEGHDPHVWLDPQNAEVWVKAIAKTLSEADSEHASIYQQNAKATISRLQQLTSEIKQQTQNLGGIKFIVFHDAYQYFEQRFGVLASGAISVSDASKPSPARITQIRNTVKELGVTCVFTEPQFNPQLVNSVFENSTVTTIGVMDPIGANIEVGKDQYNQLLLAMLGSLKQCQQ